MLDTFHCMTRRAKPSVIVCGWFLAVAICVGQDKPEVKPEVPATTPEVKIEIKGEIKAEVKPEVKPEDKPEEEPKELKKPLVPHVSVTEKNPFRLRQPVAPSTNAVTERTSLNLRLTGITAFSNVKKALIVMTVPGTTRADSFILAEGEQQGVLEIVKIDETEGTVLVKNAGETQKLIFPSESPAASATNRTSSGSAPIDPFSRFQKRDRDKPREKSESGNPLRSIPTRQPSGTPSVPQAGVVTPEPPRFDLAVQTTAIDARSIGTLRETPRGQISSVPPTDLVPESK